MMTFRTFVAMASAASTLSASAALIDEDTLVYVTFDGTVGEAAATGANMNLVASGPTAQLATVNSAPAATYAAAVSARIGDGVIGTTPRANMSSLHTITNGVISGKANGGDGGTALEVAATNFFSGSFTLEMYFCTDGQIDATSMYSRPNLLFNGSTYYTQLTFDSTAKLLFVFHEDVNGTPTYRSLTASSARYTSSVRLSAAGTSNSKANVEKNRASCGLPDTRSTTALRSAESSRCTLLMKIRLTMLYL